MAFLWNSWNVLMRIHRERKKEKITLSVHQGSDNQIATHAKLLNIKYEFLDSVVIL